eukprot:362729-Prymnesium_polylepis.1
MPVRCLNPFTSASSCAAPTSFELRPEGSMRARGRSALDQPSPTVCEFECESWRSVTSCHKERVLALANHDVIHI